MIKEQNIQGENWDNLIILDACRFDFFKKVYKDYLDGKIEKRISKGSNTGEWLVKTFPNKYDYNYISANPYINSYGMPLNKCHSDYGNYSWNAIEHFSKIIDVSIIHPREVNKAYLSNKDDMKTIIHYMQPHYPYLSYEFNQNNHVLKIIKDIYLKFHFEKIFKLRRHPFIRQIIHNIFYPANQLNHLERISIKIGIERLHYYYEDNLRIVLKYVFELIEELNGKTIITSDHGEAFGEQGIWEHPMETHIPVLIEVPWLEVKS